MSEELVDLIVNFKKEPSDVDEVVLEKIFRGYKLHEGVSTIKITIPNDSSIPLDYIIRIVKMKLNVESVVFEISSFEKYEELVETMNVINDLNVKVFAGFNNNFDINELLEISSSKVKIIYPTINSYNITTIEKHLRNKFDNIVTNPLSLLNAEILPHDKFLEYVDAIVNFIKQNASNDVQKVMLLDMIIQKNFKYNSKMVVEQRKMDCIHPSHYPESFFVHGRGVCNGLSNLARIILNHPDLNVPTEVVDSEKHSWNSIQIKNKKYFYDFTANIDMFKSIKLNFKILNKIRKNKYFVDKNASSKKAKIIRGLLAIYSLTKPFGESFVNKIILSGKIHGIYNEITGDYEKINLDEYYSMNIIEILENYIEIKNLDVNLNSIMTNYSSYYGNYNI